LRCPFGATAFGKTVIAARLIAERKTNTLILTHRQQLLSQWMAKLAQFLEIDAELPMAATKRGRKPRQSPIGQIGAGRVDPGGIIDVAIMQSLASAGEVKECIKDYGMVIVDECHHVPAFSFEQILKRVHAKWRATSTIFLCSTTCSTDLSIARRILSKIGRWIPLTLKLMTPSQNCP
jgi:superfamily II DNA or RNA helicase